MQPKRHKKQKIYNCYLVFPLGFTLRLQRGPRQYTIQFLWDQGSSKGRKFFTRIVR